MQDSELLRYSRHILLPGFDITAQQKINQAKVLLVGIGGLGSPAAIYLAASGVGTLGLIDNDKVELTNLMRQIIHDTPSIGSAKTASATNFLTNLNPHVTIHSYCERANEKMLLELAQDYDILLDASDNAATRYAINRVSLALKLPLVAAAAIRFEGHLSVFDGRLIDSPCYHCLYGENRGNNPSCSESGVLGPMVGAIGCLQATETLKLITDCGTPLTGQLLICDALDMTWRKLKLNRDPQCPECNRFKSSD